MKNLIEVTNKIYEALSKIKYQAKLKVPGIAVVGAQSSGKSSVLEGIVGEDFLPRGGGIVTRRPLMLRLHQLKEEKKYAKFEHLPSKTFTDFNEVRDEITSATDKVTGGGKLISPKEIVLDVYSNKVPDLTLIDLPGLTKIPVGNQPKNIDIQIREIVTDYVKDENIIILAITSGNIDLANSDSLKLAREVDPSGARTIGVITKLDLIGKGESAMDVLEGKVYTLTHGYVGVVCRSQEDIDKKVSMEDALKNEDAFFNKPPYNKIKNRCGIKFLSETLSRLLLHHIREWIPPVKNNIKKLLQDENDILRSYGSDFFALSPEKQMKEFLSIITTFCDYYRAAIDGQLLANITKEFIGGARINYIFHESYEMAMNSIKGLDGLTDKDVRTAIINVNGSRSTLFLSDLAIEGLIKKQLLLLLDPSLQCMRMVHEELKEIISKPKFGSLMRYAKLSNKITELMLNLFDKLIKPTEKMIKRIIKSEDAYIRFDHPDMDIDKINILSESELEKLKKESKIVYQNDEERDKKEKENIEERKRRRMEEQKRNIDERRKRIKAELSKKVTKKKSGGIFSFFGFGGQEEEKEIEMTFNDNIASLDTREDDNEFMTQDYQPIYPLTEMDTENLKMTKKLVEAYFELAKKDITDLVIKTIATCLVKQTKEDAHDELVNALYSKENIKVLMAEDSDISMKRTKCKVKIESLKSALSALRFSLPKS